MDIKKALGKLAKQLYPKGRAFNYNEKSLLNSFHLGINEPMKQAYNGAKSILDSLLPDNDNFTSEDATQWERRLALNTNQLTPLEDRKKAILRKLNHPGQVSARQHRLFIESQLRLAGFDVRVYENRFDEGGNIVTLSFEDVTGYQHGEFEHGEFEHGDFSGVLLANYIDYIRDVDFNIGDNYRSTFFIAGDDFGTVNSLGVTSLNYGVSTNDRFATIPETRRKEFRELLLKLKPAQTVGILLINYN